MKIASLCVIVLLFTLSSCGSGQTPEPRAEAEIPAPIYPGPGATVEVVKPPAPTSEIKIPRRAKEAPEEDIRAVAEGINAFAFDLYEKLPPDEHGNLFFSPFSISTALSMAYAGARGETAKEMSTVLHHPFDGERLHLAYAGLLGKLHRNPAANGVKLHAPNAVWGPYDYKQDFLTINRDCYDAHLRKIQLAGAEPIINKWAEDHTNGKIKDLLKPHALKRAVLCLTNAVYFKGDWHLKFDKANTHEIPFHISSLKSVSTPMMSQSLRLRMKSSGDGSVTFELPYQGNSLSFVVYFSKDIMPTVSPHSFQMNSAQETATILQLPRFLIKGKSVLISDHLINLGMVRAFQDGGADFTGILDRSIHISAVIHQAYVEVNEEGTEAAAATAVVFKASLPPKIVVNRPFVFIIRDNQTGCILFMGRLTNPDTTPKRSTELGN
jgi:serpin B